MKTETKSSEKIYLKMDVRGSTARRIVRAEWYSDDKGLPIPGLHRSTATSSELDQEARAEEESKDPVVR